MAKSCWFCGASSDDVVFDREHVLPSWCRDIEPNRGNWEATSSLHTADAPTSHMFEVRGPVTDLVTKSICKPCNGGWMSRLEGTAAPLIRSLAQGEQRLLTGAQTRTLARWALKTAYVHESVNRANQFSSLSQRKKFMTAVDDVGAHRVTLFLTDKPGRNLNRFTVWRGPKEAPTFWIYSEFIHLSRLAFQVWVRSVATYPGQDAVGVPLHAVGVRVWPLERLVTPWPPRSRLRGRDLKAIAGGALALLSDEQIRAAKDDLTRQARNADTRID